MRNVILYIITNIFIISFSFALVIYTYMVFCMVECLSRYYVGIFKWGLIFKIFWTRSNIIDETQIWNPNWTNSVLKLKIIFAQTDKRRTENPTIFLAILNKTQNLLRLHFPCIYTPHQIRINKQSIMCTY